MASFRLFAGLAVLQTLLVLIGWLAALGDIEVIVVLGPLLSLSGFVLTVVAWWRGHPLGSLFGLSVPFLSTLCFTLIVRNSWTPGQAYYPINSVIAVFILAQAPLCALVIRHAQGQLIGAAKSGYQFSIAGIMLFTSFVAVALGLQRAMGFGGLVLAVLLWHVVVISWFVWTPPRKPQATYSPP
jgi:hypothetical protein